MLKSRVFLTAAGAALALVLAGCNNPTGNNNGIVECTAHEWDWVLIPHSPLRDSHEAQTCRHCGAVAETRAVTATPNFAWYGDGSAANFSIATPLSMFALAHIVNGTAEEHGGPAQFDFYGRTITLASDINLSDQPWTPIGTITQAIPWTVVDGFSGTFDGAGRAITALYVDLDRHGIGLFGAVNAEGGIKNIGVQGSVSGVDLTGGIVGWNFGIVENVRFSGNVSGGTGTGGIVGGNFGTVSGSHNAGNVSGTELTGGVAGLNQQQGTITSSFNTGIVYGNNSVGGVVGNNQGGGTVSGSYNTGSVTATGDDVGGVVGSNMHSTDTVFGSHNTGNVSGNIRVGGVIGNNSSGTVSNSFNTGNISGFHSVGGVAGQIGVSLPHGGIVSNSYNTGNISADFSVGGVVGSNRGVLSYSYNTGVVIAHGGPFAADESAGVAGGNVFDGRMSNNVSMGSHVTGSGANRLVGRSTNQELENNRARSDMLLVLPHQTVTATDGEHDNPNGADVIPGVTPTSEVFAGWDPAIWNIPGGILTVGGPLPTLRNVAWEQNPVLSPVEESQASLKNCDSF